MLLRMLGAIAVVQCLSLGAALGCTGQPGAVIFEDAFPDDSGGWDLKLPASTLAIKPPAMVFGLDSKFTFASSLNLTFATTNGDFCVRGVLPKSVAEDNPANIGIMFWAVDYNNTMLALLNNKGRVVLFNRSAGAWQEIFAIADAPGFKAEPGAANDLRVNAVDGRITVFLNGNQLRAVRAQVPAGRLRFGIWGQYDKAADNLGQIQATAFKVTAGK